MTEDRFTQAWRTHRAYLVDLAFRMLGDVGEAEDVVQEAFVRLARTRPGEIDDDRGWLTVVTSRLCLDHIRSARVRREHAADDVADSVAPLAQRPPMDPADRVTLDDDVRMALYAVLRRLGAAERVAFVLHDVFQMPFEEIAETLGRPVATCRQLARRARQRMAAAAPGRNSVGSAEHRSVTERFLAACVTGDVDGLLEVLHPQAWGIARFGPAALFEPQVVRGAPAVAANLVRFYGHGVTLVSHLDSGPAILAFVDGELVAILSLTIEDERVVKIQADVFGAKLPVRES